MPSKDLINCNPCQSVVPAALSNLPLSHWQHAVRKSLLHMGLEPMTYGLLTTRHKTIALTN
jgi:hypothetical protein